MLGLTQFQIIYLSFWVLAGILYFLVVHPKDVERNELLREIKNSVVKLSESLDRNSGYDQDED